MGQTNEWEGETEKDAFSKKSRYIQKMETDNVWAKKRSAADCSTKQNRMAFCQYHHVLSCHHLGGSQ